MQLCWVELMMIHSAFLQTSYVHTGGSKIFQVNYIFQKVQTSVLVSVWWGILTQLNLHRSTSDQRVEYTGDMIKKLSRLTAPWAQTHSEQGRFSHAPHWTTPASAPPHCDSLLFVARQHNHKNTCTLVRRVAYVVVVEEPITHVSNVSSAQGRQHLSSLTSVHCLTQLCAKCLRVTFVANKKWLKQQKFRKLEGQK